MLCFLNWSSLLFATFPVQVVVVWAEGWLAKWRDNLLSKGSSDWEDKNINLSHSSMLSGWTGSPWRVKSVYFTGNWKKFMCASETERSNVWLISIDRWNEHKKTVTRKQAGCVKVFLRLISTQLCLLWTE